MGTTLAQVCPQQAVNLGACNMAVNLWITHQIHEPDPATANANFAAELDDAGVTQALAQLQRQFEVAHTQANHHLIRMRGQQQAAQAQAAQAQGGGGQGGDDQAQAQLDLAYTECVRVHALGMNDPTFFASPKADLGWFTHFLGYDVGQAKVRGFAMFLGINDVQHAIGVVKTADTYYYYDPNAPGIYRAATPGDVGSLFGTTLSSHDFNGDRMGVTFCLMVYKLQG